MGLGEVNSEQPWETTTYLTACRRLKVLADDAIEASKVFSMLMGDDGEARQ